MGKLLFVLLVSLFFSCKKDKNCNRDMGSISGSYVVTNVKYKASAAAAETDYYNQLYMDVCERDDYVTLSASGTYTFTDAGVKCVPPGDDTGTWAVSGSVLTVDGNTFTIQSFDCSVMVIMSVDVLAAGDQMRLTLTRR